MQKLLSKIRQAINDYNLIEDGDKIAVGLSGGKDSLTLLHLLNLDLLILQYAIILLYLLLPFHQPLTLKIYLHIIT